MPEHYAAGQIAGDTGLSSERDFTTGPVGKDAFGDGGALEAKGYPNQLFGFTFTYKAGSYYYGHVVDDGSYRYYDGETITTAYDHYHINDSSPLTSGEGGLVSGEVYTQNYYDITSGRSYDTSGMRF